MSSIGFIPSKTSVQVREPDGDSGTIPGASRASAGVMTAQQCAMLEEVFQWFQTQSGSGAPVIIERAADTSRFPTREEVRQLMQAALPRLADATPEVRALRQQVEHLTQNMQQSRGLPSPETGNSSATDTVAREVIETVIVQMESMDQRLRRIESVLDTLGHLAELKSMEGKAA